MVEVVKMTGAESGGATESSVNFSRTHNQEKQKLDGIVVKSAVPKYRWVNKFNRWAVFLRSTFWLSQLLNFCRFFDASNILIACLLCLASLQMFCFWSDKSWYSAPNIRNFSVHWKNTTLKFEKLYHFSQWSNIECHFVSEKNIL